MKPSFGAAPIALVLAATLAVGCVHRVDHEPPPPTPVPETYANARPSDDGPSSGGDATPAATGDALRWWTTFGDPTLDELVETALRDSLDVRSAIARVQQARALAMQARAARMPQVGFQVGANASHTITGGIGSFDAQSAEASLPMSYEVDLFARRASEHHAARLDADAGELDAYAVAIATSAQIADTWFDVLEVRARRKLLETQRTTNQSYYELVMLRFRQGLSPAVDVHQQRQQLAATEGLLALVDGQEVVLRQQLALLLGALPPAELAEDRVELPRVPSPPSRPVPASLLENRPDLRAAQRRVESADRRVGAIVAARLPTLMLSFSPGYRWQRSRRQATPSFPVGGVSTVDGFVWNANATLSVPLFDGLAGRAATKLQEAQLEERLVAYERIVLGALVEVESALALERQQHVNVQQLESQLVIANETLAATQDRYRAGLSDFLPVLTALRAQQGIELQLLAARRALLSYRVQLHRALGGRLPDSLETRPAGDAGDVEAP